FSECSCAHRFLPSFPTRRSSDLLLAYISGGPSIATDTLPAGLTDREFWQMIVDFSEPGGYFRSDNFLSNESGYQSVIPTLHKTVDRKSTRLNSSHVAISYAVFCL